MIIDQLNEILNSTDPHTTMHVFCTYIKSHMNEMPHMSIDEVAKACFMSKGQISKCAKALGFASYIEFKDACSDYSHSICDKPIFFSKDKKLPSNVKKFGYGIAKSIVSVSDQLDYNDLNHLIRDILNSQTVYLYAQGDNRSLCNVLQVELSIYGISIVICDADFKKHYEMKPYDILIILSTNGTIFRLNKKIISRLMNTSIKTWLITCNQTLSFSRNILSIPSHDIHYNKFAIRYVIDIIIASIQSTFLDG